MSRALRMLATLVLGSQLWAESPGRFLAPSYSAASIVNSASYQAAALSANTIASLFGTDLAYSTGAVSQTDVGAGAMPTVLAGVRVFVSGMPASLYYVSPKQINFLIPAELRPGDATVFVAREGTHGPILTVTLADASPGLFQVDAATIVATHLDGSLLTNDAPGKAGEVVVIYCTGLGRTNPDVIDGQIAYMVAFIRAMPDLRVVVGGTPVDTGRIYYAGVTPGYPGLYQINVRLPDRFTANPEVRVALGEQISPPGLTISAH